MLNTDSYLEIAKRVDTKTILNMLSVNKDLRRDEIFKNLILRKYPLLAKYKSPNETWKEFSLKMIYYVGKLEEEYKYTQKQLGNKNPEKIYGWYKLLEKFEKWRHIGEENYMFSPAPNVYDLLYNTENQGNVGEMIGVSLINENRGKWENYKYLSELRKFTPIHMFGEESKFCALDSNELECDTLDYFYNRRERPYLPFDYEYLINVLSKNGKNVTEFDVYENEEFEGMDEYKSNNYKVYDKLYVQKLKENEIMSDYEKLRFTIKDENENMIDWLLQEDKGIHNYKEEDLLLTDKEIDLVLDLHHRVLNREVSIITQTSPENLA